MRMNFCLPPSVWSQTGDCKNIEIHKLASQGEVARTWLDNDTSMVWRWNLALLLGVQGKHDLSRRSKSLCLCITNVLGQAIPADR